MMGLRVEFSADFNPSDSPDGDISSDDWEVTIQTIIDVDGATQFPSLTIKGDMAEILFYDNGGELEKMFGNAVDRAKDTADEMKFDLARDDIFFDDK